MLAFGDMAWVLFTYGLQARYLAFTPVDLTMSHTATILGTVLLGYYIFRGEAPTARRTTSGITLRNQA